MATITSTTIVQSTTTTRVEITERAPPMPGQVKTSPSSSRNSAASESVQPPEIDPDTVWAMPKEGHIRHISISYKRHRKKSDGPYIPQKKESCCVIL